MKKWFYSLLVLLLFSGAALADATNPTITSTAVTNKTDLSIAYLSSFFGTVSGVLTGTSGQMFGKLMYQFNQGILVLAGVWLGFSMVSIVFKAVTSGSFMQQDGKGGAVHMVMLRIALGFSCLIPNSSTGYTLLQGIVMQVAVQGVKLADQIWEYGLDYMNSGGALWSRPVQQGGSGGSAKSIMSATDINSLLGTSNSIYSVSDWNNLSMIQKVMAMEACMVQSSIDNDNTSSDSVSNSASYSVNEDLDKFSFSFPGKTGDGNKCGTVYWNYLAKSSTPLNCTAGANGDDNNQCGYSHLALREVIFELLPAVTKLVCVANGDKNTAASACGSIDPNSDDSYMPDAMMSALLNYKNLIDPLVRADMVPPSKNSALDFITQAKKDGWMTAGRYYWDILQVEGTYDYAMTNSAQYRNYIPTSYGSNPGSNSPPDVSGLAVPTPDILVKATGGTGGFIDRVDTQIVAFSGAASAGNGASSMSSSFGALKWLLVLLGPVIGDLVGLLMAFSTNMGPLGLGPQPILWLHNIGIYCIGLSGDIWLGMGMSVFMLMTISGICSGVQSMGNSIKAALDWLQPIILGAGAGFFAVGILLGFINPLHPYMVFTFGIINYLIQVIYAMVAAPLVAMGVTRPEGHDFLGSSQQAVMLLVSLFVRPALMVIGMFSGMILCQVISGMILYTFSGFINDIFYVGAPISGAPGGDILIHGAGRAIGNVFAGGTGNILMQIILPLLIFPLFLGIFAMTIYTATTTCFALIYELGDYINQWIGAPQSHSIPVGQLADSMKSGASGAASKLGDSGTRGKISNSNGQAGVKAEEKKDAAADTATQAKSGGATDAAGRPI